jgi:RNA polymerase sigma factor (sigma-70 family)
VLAGAFTTVGTLWSRVAAGDPAAFEEVYVRFSDRVHGFAFRRSGSWDLADEVTSGTFLEAWRKRAEVELESREDDAILPWLLGVAANLMRNAGRKQQRYQSFLAGHAPLAVVPDFSDDVASQVDGQRDLDTLRQAMDLLGDDDRDILLLCVAEGLTPTQVATALDLPPGTVRSRLSRARSRLRVLLEELDPHTDGGR